MKETRPEDRPETCINVQACSFVQAPVAPLEAVDRWPNELLSRPNLRNSDLSTLPFAPTAGWIGPVQASESGNSVVFGTQTAKALQVLY
jgi:hypothetical protein